MKNYIVFMTAFDTKSKDISLRRRIRKIEGKW